MLPSLSLLDLQPTLDDIHAFSFKTQITHGFDPKLLCRKLGGLKGWKNMNQRSARSTHQKSTRQKQTKNAMDMSTPSPKRISRTDAKFKNAQGEPSERKG
jgi:hypothetical protein